MSKRKILVIDDETQILRVLRHVFSAPDYSVKTAQDGAAGLEAFNEGQPDAVITDLQMPGIDGLEVCRRVREVSDVPLIVLSVRDEEKTIVAALDAGADDYVTKPFSTAELLARVRSVLRRVPERHESRIDAGDFVVDVEAHSAEVRAQTVRLTPKEFDLLVCLLRHPDRVLTHSFLLREVWGQYYSEQSEALRVLVGSLRKKIESDPSQPRYLITEPWIGYRFSPTGSL
ncbi:MAG: response regulator transcription factor [Pyrinomonadaceae bacterium]